MSVVQEVWTERPGAAVASGSLLRTSLPPFTHERLRTLDWILRLATAGAFIGHGAYGAFVQKPGWYPFFAELGVGRTVVDERNLVIWAGGFEMLLGALALVAPIPALLLFMCVWKLATEFVWYPLSGKQAFEFVERWSNYTAPLALILVRGWPRSAAGWFSLQSRWRREAK
jgi:hypothetical protein